MVQPDHRYQRDLARAQRKVGQRGGDQQLPQGGGAQRPGSGCAGVRGRLLREPDADYRHSDTSQGKHDDCRRRGRDRDRERARDDRARDIGQVEHGSVERER